jgi:hypothetical protein
VSGRGPRHRRLAVFGGHEYRATPIGADGALRLFHDGAAPPPDGRFTRHPHGEVWVLAVRAEDCDRVVEVTTRARHGRNLCLVEGVTASGVADLYFLRNEGARSTPPAAFERIDPGEYRTAVPVRELVDYHEIHRDLLFDYWRTTPAGSMRTPRPRLGTYATVAGVDLLVESAPPEACDRLFSVTTRASWRGELCAVMAVADDRSAVLNHLGNNRAKSATDGFRPLVPGTYARTVHVTELDAYHEYQADLPRGWLRG